MTKSKDPNKLAAFHHAAQAVLAFHYGIQVRSITIEPDFTGRTYTRLEPIKDYCDLRAPKSIWALSQFESYITTLLGGIVGRQLCVEAYFGYKSRCSGQVKLRARYLAKLGKGDEIELDRAFAIAFGWLRSRDEGITMQTLYRLWQRAQDRLRTPKHRKRLSLLADRLKVDLYMSGRDVIELFAE
jgi:hypothetical protein